MRTQFSEQWGYRCHGVSLQLLALPVGVTVGKWRPFFSQSSLHMVWCRIKQTVWRPIHRKKQQSRQRLNGQLVAFAGVMREKPRSHSADDAGSNETRRNSIFYQTRSYHRIIPDLGPTRNSQGYIHAPNDTVHLSSTHWATIRIEYTTHRLFTIPIISITL